MPFSVPIPHKISGKKPALSNPTWNNFQTLLITLALIYGLSIYLFSDALRSTAVEGTEGLSPTTSLPPGYSQYGWKQAQPPSLRDALVGAEGMQKVISKLADRKGRRLWVEKKLDSPRVSIIHNLASSKECDQLVQMGVDKGLEKALITPYGSSTLIESSYRNNRQAWLDFQQNGLVSRIEQDIALITGTDPVHGENMQILHYNKTEQFREHHDYHDPLRHPVETFAQGGNRMATIVLYLNEPEEGGDTEFNRIKVKLKPQKGDAILFWDMKPNCDGIDPDCPDPLTEHAGRPPIKGEKWVATKWIHERPYQIASTEAEGYCFDKHPRCKEWARDDSPSSPSECYVNEDWMLKHCRYSCGACQKEKVRPLSPTVPSFDPTRGL